MRLKMKVLILMLVVSMLFLQIVEARATTINFTENIGYTTTDNENWNVIHGGYKSGYGNSQIQGYVKIGPGAGARLSYVKLYWRTYAFYAYSLKHVEVTVTLHVGGNYASKVIYAWGPDTDNPPFDCSDYLIWSTNLWVSGSGRVFAEINTEAKTYYFGNRYLDVECEVAIYPF